MAVKADPPRPPTDDQLMIDLSPPPTSIALVPCAVDEILRFEPPAIQLCRYVTRDVEFYGQTVPSGSVMMSLNGSANRDHRAFPPTVMFSTSSGRLATKSPLAMETTSVLVRRLPVSKVTLRSTRCSTAFRTGRSIGTTLSLTAPLYVAGGACRRSRRSFGRLV
jgi:hypothetical protein